MSDEVVRPRSGLIHRQTSETDIHVSVVIDGTGTASVSTGIAFLDPMIGALARHGRMDVELRAKGDLQVDDHHTAEGCALALGAALDGALGDRSGIARFGHAYAPLRWRGRWWTCRGGPGRR